MMPRLGTLRRVLLLRVSVVTCALALVLLFALFHLFGWRDNTAIISGTAPAAGGTRAIGQGVLYALAYFSAVVVAPILLLASAFYTILRRFFARRSAPAVPVASHNLPG